MPSVKKAARKESPASLITRAEARAAGLTRYFTGKSCPHGHTVERMVSSCGCTQCILDRMETPKGRAYDKIKSARPESVQRRADFVRGKGKESHARRVRRWVDNNPQKKRAHGIVKRAVASGLLVKEPCYKCGDVRSQAHHNDYNKPLEVLWCCAKHHSELHHGQS